MFYVCDALKDLMLVGKNSQLQKEAHMIGLNKMPQDVDIRALCSYMFLSHYNTNPKMYAD